MTHADFAISLAYKAGRIIKKYFFAGVEKQYKEHQSIVTIADKEVNALVADAIQKEFPDHGFLGEEGGHFNQKTEFVWICDPIDGTLPFAHGVPIASFSIALVRHGKPILGVVFNPFVDRLYSAEDTQGAYLNSKRIHVNSSKELYRGLAGICVWNKAHYDISKTFLEFYNRGIDYQTGSTAYLGALVASGEAIANVFPDIRPWDVAAQKIIVEEANGKTSDLFGNDQRYDQDTKGFIASNGLVHDQLVEIVGKTVKS